MALTAEEEMLISIIEFNQRKIEELLISRSQAYEVQNKLLLLNPAAVSHASKSKSNNSVSDSECVDKPVSLTEKIVPKILTSFFNDSTSNENVDATAAARGRQPFLVNILTTMMKINTNCPKKYFANGTLQLPNTCYISS